MNLTDLIGAGKELGPRFNLIGLLPAGVLALFVLALVRSGAPGEPPDLGRLAAEAEDLGVWEGALVLLAVTVAALVFQPLQLSLVRLLEGYWGSSRPADFLARPGKALHRRRRGRLVHAAQVTGRAPTEAEKERMVGAFSALRRSYPSPERILPTRLGNVLRAAEDRSGRRYGLEAVVAWPRLYPLLSERVRAVLDDGRDQLDLSARFCAVFLLAAAISLGLLAGHGPWLGVPAGALVLAWLSYRAAVAAALAYGEAIESAFDLHRFDLLRALHLPLPADGASEREANKLLTEFLLQGDRADFRYDHGDGQGEQGAARTGDEASGGVIARLLGLAPPRSD